MRGKLVVFEGIDFCGKTTQIELLKPFLEESFENDVFIYTREPGSYLTDSGSKIRSILLESTDDISSVAEAFLFAADRNIHCKKIREILESGKNVICDRFFYSSIAYQCYAGDRNIKSMLDMTLKATDGLVPDLLYVFEMDEKTYESRAKNVEKKDRIEKKINKKFLKDIIIGFQIMFDDIKYYKYEELLPKIRITIDASQDEETILSQIKETIEFIRQ